MICGSTASWRNSSMTTSILNKRVSPNNKTKKYTRVFCPHIAWSLGTTSKMARKFLRRISAHGATIFWFRVAFMFLPKPCISFPTSTIRAPSCSSRGPTIQARDLESHTPKSPKSKSYLMPSYLIILLGCGLREMKLIRIRAYFSRVSYRERIAMTFWSVIVWVSRKPKIRSIIMRKLRCRLAPPTSFKSPLLSARKSVQN